MSRKQLDPIPPGEILREEFMRPLGISITALARDIAVPANRISQIVNARLHRDVALKFLPETHLGSATPCPAVSPAARSGRPSRHPRRGAP